MSNEPEFPHDGTSQEKADWVRENIHIESIGDFLARDPKPEPRGEMEYGCMLFDNETGEVYSGAVYWPAGWREKYGVGHDD